MRKAYHPSCQKQPRAETCSTSARAHIKQTCKVCKILNSRIAAPMSLLPNNPPSKVTVIGKRHKWPSRMVPSPPRCHICIYSHVQQHAGVVVCFSQAFD